MSSLASRARTESIHFDSRKFDSPKWIKIHKKILVREVYQIFFWFLIHVGESFYFWFWFILIHFRSERIAMIHFDSLWFSILIRFDSPEKISNDLIFWLKLWNNVFFCFWSARLYVLKWSVHRFSVFWLVFFGKLGGLWIYLFFCFSTLFWSVRLSVFKWTDQRF